MQREEREERIKHETLKSNIHLSTSDCRGGSNIKNPEVVNPEKYNLSFSFFASFLVFFISSCMKFEYFYL